MANLISMKHTYDPCMLSKFLALFWYEKSHLNVCEGNFGLSMPKITTRNWLKGGYTWLTLVGKGYALETLQYHYAPKENTAADWPQECLPKRNEAVPLRKNLKKKKEMGLINLPATLGQSALDLSVCLRHRSILLFEAIAVFFSFHHHNFFFLFCAMLGIIIYIYIYIYIYISLGSVSLSIRNPLCFRIEL